MTNARGISTLSSGFMSNAYRYYGDIRDMPPVFWSDHDGAWLVHTKNEVQTILSDLNFEVIELSEVVKGVGARAGKVLEDLTSVLDSVLFLRNPPQHTARRQFLVAALNGRPLSSHEPTLQRIARKLLPPKINGASFDAIVDFADQLPPLFMGELLGLCEADSLKLIKIMSEVTKSFDRGRSLRFYKRIDDTIAEARAIIAPYLSERRSAPRDDAMTRMIELSNLQFHLDEKTLSSHVLFLMIAGAETTSALIGNAIAAVLDHMDWKEELAINPRLIDSWIEETLRHDGPVQQSTRIARSSCKIAGVDINSGDRVVLLIGSAHHDGAHFPNPQQFDPQRVETGNHLGFGHGLHYCLGASLARLEARIALREIVPYLRNTSHQVEREWWEHRTIRRLVSLPVTLADSDEEPTKC